MYLLTAASSWSPRAPSLPRRETLTNPVKSFRRVLLQHCLTNSLNKDNNDDARNGYSPETLFCKDSKSPGVSLMISTGNDCASCLASLIFHYRHSFPAPCIIVSVPLSVRKGRAVQVDSSLLPCILQLDHVLLDHSQQLVLVPCLVVTCIETLHSSSSVAIP